MLVQIEDKEVDIDLDAYEAGVKEHFEKKGLAWKKAEEIEAEKTALKTETEKTTKDTITKAIHSDWENAAGEIFGEKRPDGKKGLDWFKEKGTELKTKASATPPPAGSDKEAQAALKQVKDEFETFKKEQATEKTQTAQKAIKTAVKSVVRSLPVTGETDAEKQARHDALEQLVFGKYKLEFSDDDRLMTSVGEELITDTATNQAMSLDKIIKRDLGFMLAEEKKEDPIKKVGGTGTKPDPEVVSVDGKKAIKAGTTDEIRAKARSLGLIAGSAASREFYAESCKLSGLDPEK